MIEKLQNAWFQWLTEQWGRPAAGAVAAVTIPAALLLAVFGSGNVPGPSHWGAAAVLGVAAAGLWVLTNCPPRARVGRLGVIVAIASEHDQLERQVRTDFVDHLRANLAKGDAGPLIDLLEYPRWLAVRVRHDTREGYMRRSRAQLVVYGRVVERNTTAHGAKTYVLSLNHAVVHKAAPTDAEREFAPDRPLFLPPKLGFADADSCFHFEAASEWLEVSALYILGLAAYLSGDAVTAERLYLRAKAELPRVAPRVSPVREIAQRLPSRLTQLYTAWMAALSAEYVRTRRRDALEQLHAVNVKLLAQAPEAYGALVNAAATSFLAHRDIQGARRLLKKCRRSRDPAWRYSVAFLNAYEGKEQLAINEYRRAFDGQSTDANLPVVCEESIDVVLREEPERVQLHFFSGLINFHVKRDRQAARRDFETFLHAVGPAQYVICQGQARKYLIELTVMGDEPESAEATPVDYRMRSAERYAG